LYDYVSQRTKLYNALEADDAGTLIHPVFAPGSGMLVMCERFTMSENRERGGYTQFDMQFVEAGTAVSATGIQDNTAAVKSNAAAADQAASNIQLTGRIRTNPDGSPITGPPQQFFRQLRR
jgi:prophage DNA circulation protein